MIISRNFRKNRYQARSSSSICLVVMIHSHFLINKTFDRSLEPVCWTQSECVAVCSFSVSFCASPWAGTMNLLGAAAKTAQQQLEEQQKQTLHPPAGDGDHQGAREMREYMGDWPFGGVAFIFGRCRCRCLAMWRWEWGWGWGRCRLFMATFLHWHFCCVVAVAAAAADAAAAAALSEVWSQVDDVCVRQ